MHRISLVITYGLKGVSGGAFEHTGLPYISPSHSAMGWGLRLEYSVRAAVRATKISGFLGVLRLRKTGRGCTEDGIADTDLLALQAKKQSARDHPEGSA